MITSPIPLSLKLIDRVRLFYAIPADSGSWFGAGSVVALADLQGK
jgi:hypothetical protein